jgi:two-component system, chemotaxis family, sensor kinase CheA
LGSSDDRFREMFFEEAREHLISLEEGLMDLERRQGDRAHLDKTFRAAHTIKGAAAMVGLEPIARFTHGIEAVLEKIRTGSLAVDSDIITTLLESRDHLAAMVEGYAAGSPVPGSGDLSQRLSDLLRVTPPGPAPAPSRPAPEAGGPSRPRRREQTSPDHHPRRPRLREASNRIPHRPPTRSNCLRDRTPSAGASTRWACWTNCASSASRR